MKIYFKIGLFFLLLPIHSQDIGFSNVLKEVYPDKNEFNYPKNSIIIDPFRYIFNVKDSKIIRIGDNTTK